ncbi:uncharacterized protein LOC144036862 [Vanacampus margaritifer]
MDDDTRCKHCGSSFLPEDGRTDSCLDCRAVAATMKLLRAVHTPVNTTEVAPHQDAAAAQGRSSRRWQWAPLPPTLVVVGQNAGPLLLLPLTIGASAAALPYAVVDMPDATLQLPSQGDDVGKNAVSGRDSEACSDLHSCWSNSSVYPRLPADARALASMRFLNPIGLDRMPNVVYSVASLIVSPEETLREAVRCPSPQLRLMDELVTKSYKATTGVATLRRISYLLSLQL